MKYEKPILNIVEFRTEDIITTSGDDFGDIYAGDTGGDTSTNTAD